MEKKTPEISTETGVQHPGPLGSISPGTPQRTANDASDEDVCIELLVGGHVQSFVDLFHLTKVNREGDASSNQREPLSGKNLQHVKDKLISAEMSRRQDEQRMKRTGARRFHTAGEADTSLRFYEKGLETAQMSKNRLSEVKANHNFSVAPSSRKYGDGHKVPRA